MKIGPPSDLSSIENCAISADGLVLVWRDLRFFVLDPSSMIWQPSARLEDTFDDNKAPPEETEASRVRFVGWVGDHVMAMLRDRCGVWKPGEDQWSWLRPGYGHGSEEFQRKFEHEYQVWSRVARVRAIQNWVFFEKFTGSPPWTGTRVIEAYQLVGNRLVDRGLVPVDSHGERPFDVWLVEDIPAVVLGKHIVRPGLQPTALSRDGIDTYRPNSEVNSDLGRGVLVGSRVVIPSQAGRSRLINLENLSIEMVPLADLRLGGAIWKSWVSGDRDQGRRWLWSGIRALSKGIGPLVTARQLDGVNAEPQETLVIGRRGVVKLPEEPAPSSIDWPLDIEDRAFHLTRYGPWLLWALGPGNCPAFASALVRYPENERIQDALRAFGCPSADSIERSLQEVNAVRSNQQISDLATVLSHNCDQKILQEIVENGVGSSAPLKPLALELMALGVGRNEGQDSVIDQHLGAVVGMLNDPTPGVRAAAAEVVAKQNPDLMSLENLDDPIADVRLATISAIGKRRVKDDLILNVLEQFSATEPNRQVRYKALECLNDCARSSFSQRAAISAAADPDLWQYYHRGDIDLMGFRIQEPELSDLVALSVLMYLVRKQEEVVDLWVELAMSCVDSEFLSEGAGESSMPPVSNLSVLMALWMDNVGWDFRDWDEGWRIEPETGLGYLQSHNSALSTPLELPAKFDRTFGDWDSQLWKAILGLSSELATWRGSGGQSRVSPLTAELLKMLDPDYRIETTIWSESDHEDTCILCDHFDAEFGHEGLAVSTVMALHAAAGFPNARDQLARRIEGGQTARWPILQVVIAAFLPNCSELLNRFLASEHVPLFRKFDLLAGRFLPRRAVHSAIPDSGSQEAVPSKVEKVVLSLDKNLTAEVYREVSADPKFEFEDRLEAARRLAHAKEYQPLAELWEGVDEIDLDEKLRFERNYDRQFVLPSATTRLSKPETDTNEEPR